MKVKTSGTSVLLKLSKKETQINWDETDVINNIDHITHLEIIAKETLEIPSLKDFIALKNLTLSATNLLETQKLKELNLERLKISGTDLEDIPLISFDVLTNLSIPRNKIIDTIIENKNAYPLEQLDLGQNKITELAIDFKCFPRLKRLNLEHNQLTTLPETLFELKELSHLALKGNPLDEKTQQRLYDRFKMVIEN